MHTRSLKTTTARRRARAFSAALGGILFLAALFAGTVSSPVPALGQEEGQEAMFRMAHLSPDTPEADVYVDDELVTGDLRNVSFGTISPYLPLSAGTRNVKVYPAGGDPETSEPIFEADVDLEGEDWYTLPVVGLAEDGSLGAKIFEDDNSPPSEGNARLRLIHAVPDVGPATVGVRGGEDLFSLPGFSNASDYTEVPAGTHTLEVRPTGTDGSVLSVPDVTLSAGEVYTAFAVGQAADEGSLAIILTADSERYGAAASSEEPPQASDPGSCIAPVEAAPPPAPAPPLDALDVLPGPSVSSASPAVEPVPPMLAPSLEALEPLAPGPELSVPVPALEIPAPVSLPELPAPAAGPGIDYQPGVTAPVVQDVREPVREPASEAIPTTPQPVPEPVATEVTVPDPKVLSRVDVVAEQTTHFSQQTSIKVNEEVGGANASPAIKVSEEVEDVDASPDRKKNVESTKKRQVNRSRDNSDGVPGPRVPAPIAQQAV